MKDPKKDDSPEGEIIYASATLGVYLRRARLKAGFSLRELERRSGVSDSEIFQIESGAQECRLASFIRACAALGVPCGHVLDNVVSGNFRPYFEKIAVHPMVLEFAQKDEEIARLLSVNLGMMAAFAAHLIRCSRPKARAAAMEYPTEQIKEAFLNLANLLDSDFGAIERLSILAALSDDPLNEMARLLIFLPDTLRALLGFLTSDSAAAKNWTGGRLEKLTGVKSTIPVWTPFLPPIDF